MEYRIRWPRPGYRVLDWPADEWLIEWRKRNPRVTKRHGLYGEHAPLYGGGSHADRIDVQWPAGGLLVPLRQARDVDFYNPLNRGKDTAATILRDISRMHLAGADNQIRAEVLAFANKWGLLGIGLEGAEDFGSADGRADGVTRTAEHLKAVQACYRTIGNFRSVPRMNLAEAINRHLHVTLAAERTANSLIPVLRVPTLLAALTFKLLQIATGHERLRECVECQGIFYGRANKIFCSWPCKNRYTVRKYRRRKRATHKTRRRPRP